MLYCACCVDASITRDILTDWFPSSGAGQCADRGKHSRALHPPVHVQSYSTYISTSAPFHTAQLGLGLSSSNKFVGSQPVCETRPWTFPLGVVESAVSLMTNPHPSHTQTQTADVHGKYHLSM
jgi:hypothetical protein